MPKLKERKKHWTFTDAQLVKASEALSTANTVRESLKANSIWKRFYFIQKPKYEAKVAEVIAEATKYGVTAGYSNVSNTLFVSGDDAKVKSFIRVINLRGRDAYFFNIAQSNA